jgi:AmmeMemoRadiSam system protein A
MLTAVERRVLLETARQALAAAVNASVASRDPVHRLPPGSLQESLGAFVTLRSLGAPADAAPRPLRGCIGTVSAASPLVETVAEMARAAALRDPRFAPLTADELDRVRIEISVLGPRRRVHGPGDLAIGRDGVELVLGSRRSVFLPQVAVEQGWDAEQLLRQLAVKAGLGPDAWRQAELSAFSAEVFGEDDQSAGG